MHDRSWVHCLYVINFGNATAIKVLMLESGPCCRESQFDDAVDNTCGVYLSAQHIRYVLCQVAAVQSQLTVPRKLQCWAILINSLAKSAY